MKVTAEIRADRRAARRGVGPVPARRSGHDRVGPSGRGRAAERGRAVGRRPARRLAAARSRGAQRRPPRAAPRGRRGLLRLAAGHRPGRAAPALPARPAPAVDAHARAGRRRRRHPAGRRGAQGHAARAARRARTRKEVTALLAYEEDEAGGLMSTRYARLRPQMTADEAISFLRRQARDARRDHLLRLRRSSPISACSAWCRSATCSAPIPGRPSPRSWRPTWCGSPTRWTRRRSRACSPSTTWTVVPVVDAEGKMKGIVTVDDIVDVVQEEATEDAQKFGGVAALEVPYLQSTPRRHDQEARRVADRSCSSARCSRPPRSGSFEDQIDQVPLLALFIPMIVSSGGNSGSQASTLVIRAMALGEVRARRLVAGPAARARDRARARAHPRRGLARARGDLGLVRAATARTT